MPRPSNVDVDQAVASLVREVVHKLNRSHFVRLRPCNTGPDSIKKYFKCGSDTAEKLYKLCIKALVEKGYFVRPVAKRKPCIAFKSEASASIHQVKAKKATPTKFRKATKAKQKRGLLKHGRSTAINFKKSNNEAKQKRRDLKRGRATAIHFKKSNNKAKQKCGDLKRGHDKSDKRRSNRSSHALERRTSTSSYASKRPSGDQKRLRAQGETSFKCPEGHPLKGFSVDAGACEVTCDGCASMQETGAIMYGCRQCSKNICSGCATSILAERSCPVGHALTKFVMGETGKRCHECKLLLPKEVAMYSCRMCNFDLCLDCASPAAASLSTSEQKQCPSGRTSEAWPGQAEQPSNAEEEEAPSPKVDLEEVQVVHPPASAGAGEVQRSDALQDRSDAHSQKVQDTEQSLCKSFVNASLGKNTKRRRLIIQNGIRDCEQSRYFASKSSTLAIDSLPPTSQAGRESDAHIEVISLADEHSHADLLPAADSSMEDESEALHRLSKVRNVQVRPSHISGRGLFTKSACKQHEVLLRERPLCIFALVSDDALLTSIKQLSGLHFFYQQHYAAIQTVLRGQHHQICSSLSGGSLSSALAKEAWDDACLLMANLKLSQAVSAIELQKTLLVWKFNSFEVEDNEGNKSMVLFERLSFGNHACTPSAQVTWQPKQQLMVLSALRKHSCNEEVTVNYMPRRLRSTAERRELLRHGWDFFCRCSKCEA